MLKFSAVVNCFNEEDFIAVAIKSISKYADEIVVVDNCSTDRTVEIVSELISHEYLSNKIKLFSLDKPMQLADVRNFALTKATNEWVIKWDGDFCAFSDDDELSSNCESFQCLIDKINLAHNDYDIFLLYSLNLSGDFYHYDSTRKYLGLSGDSFIGRKSCMRYVADDKYGDIGFLRCPDGSIPRFFYMNKPENNPMFFLHIYGVKGDSYLLYRMFMSEYQVWLTSHAFIPFWDWMEKVKLYNTGAGLEYVKTQIIKNLERHDINLPKILRPLLENPKYQVVYVDGKISERLENY